MLLPDKHITLAESILGLGAFLLEQLDRPRTVDSLYQRVVRARDDLTLPAFHDLDAVILAVAFLYSIAAVRSDTAGAIARCDS